MQTFLLAILEKEFVGQGDDWLEFKTSTQSASLETV